MYKNYDINGVVYTDAKECVLYEWKNGISKKLGSMQIYLQNQFKNGGQSTNRLARNRDIQRDHYVTSLAEKTVNTFYDKENSIQKVKNILFCGPAEFKRELAEHSLISSFFTNVHIVTMGEFDQTIIDETLRNIEDPRIRIVSERIRKLVSTADDKLVFGEDIIPHLQMCLIGTLYIHPNSNLLKNTRLSYDPTIIEIEADVLEHFGGAIGVKYY